MAMRDLVPFSRGRGRGQLARQRAARDPFTRLHQEMDQMFEDFFPDLYRPGRGEMEAWGPTPRVDVSETDEAVEVTAELPGVDEKDIDVRIDGDVLTVSGEKRETSENKEKGWYQSECRYGSFSRSIPLGTEVDTDKADATFKNGVLHLSMPKVTPTRQEGKQIKVRGE